MNARAKPAPPARPAGLPSDADLEAQDARIGEIRIQVRDVFDFESGDQESTVSRLANQLHISTRESTVHDQLLFESGDVYRARLLDESARILRATRYLRDASVRPVAFHDGVVDVEVIAQDVWTFNPGISFGRSGGKNSAGVELEELNLLGTGMYVGIGATSNVDRDTRYARFRDPQLGSSWWSLSLSYNDNSDGEVAAFALDLPFHSLDARRAGGVAAVDGQRIDSRYDLGEVIDRYAVDIRGATIYLGRSRGLVDGAARRYSYGFTWDSSEFAPVAGEAAPRLLPADRKLAYPWVGVEWVEDAFRTVRNRDQIEKTEDYSLGRRAHLRLGLAAESLGSDRDAVIFSAGISDGAELGPRQSLFMAASLDGRVEQGSVADGVLAAGAHYYRRQSMRRVFYASLDAVAGMNPDDDRQFLLGGDNGLRGYPLRYQSGEGHWKFTVEQRFFSDWYPWQLFHVGGAVFFDMGASWGRDPLGAPSLGVLKDVGFGLRFGNSRSALGGVLHVDLAFPLDGDDSIDDVQLLVETRASF